MFKLAKERQVLWPVTVQVPEDGGPQAVDIQVRYRLLTRSELKALAGALAGVSGDTDALLAELDARLSDRITGWEGIADEAGKPLPFTPENMAAVLDVPYLRDAIEQGLYAASRGALAKN